MSGCHIEALSGTTVIQTDLISTSWLRVVDKVVADIDFHIGKLIQANGTIVSGTVLATDLTDDGVTGNYLNIAAGARVILSGSATGTVIPEDTRAIVGVKTTGVNIMPTFSIYDNGFVQVVDTK